MPAKLEWEYDHHSDEYHAIHNDHRIRAVRDQDASNPFQDSEGQWPIVVRDPDGRGQPFTCYEFGKEVTGKHTADLGFFDKALLIHDQHAILKALGWGRSGASATTNMKDAFETYLTDEPVGYCTDADVLQDLFEHVLDDNSDSEKLGQLAKLHQLAGSYAYCANATGHSQGDWCEVLVVADKATIEKFGCETHIEELKCEVRADPAIRDVIARIGGLPHDQFLAALDNYVHGEVSRKLLAPVVQLYEDWAYGNAWGYIVEKASCPASGASIYLDEGGPSETFIQHFPTLEEAEDFLGVSATIDPDHLKAGNYSVIDYDDPDSERLWEELPEGSCWGYFGDEFHESGLEEAALECVPDREMADA